MDAALNFALGAPGSAQLVKAVPKLQDALKKAQ